MLVVEYLYPLNCKHFGSRSIQIVTCNLIQTFHLSRCIMNCSELFFIRQLFNCSSTSIFKRSTMGTVQFVLKYFESFKIQITISAPLTAFLAGTTCCTSHTNLEAPLETVDNFTEEAESNNAAIFCFVSSFCASNALFSFSALHHNSQFVKQYLSLCFRLHSIASCFFLCREREL